EAGGSAASSRSVPPRWALAADAAATQTPFGLAVIAVGPLPILIVFTVGAVGSMREIVSEPRFATHTNPRLTVIACGSRPTWNTCSTVKAGGVGLILHTVPSRLFATQTDPRPYVIALGPYPAPMTVGGVARLCGSIRAILSVDSSVTHNAPAPAAIAVGSTPTARCRVTRRPLGSTRATVPSRVFVTQMA